MLGLLEEDEVEEHFKADLEETGSLTSQDDGHIGGGLTEPSTHPSEEEGSEASEDNSVISQDVNVLPAQTNYTEDPPEVFGTVSDQTEEFSEENKSIVWFLMKQVRPGMDLSKVVLPTFILEPRSFLDKISDYYYHADIISRVGHTVTL